jgi:transaldolase
LSAAIGKYKPQDATTNPSLILAASKKTEYAKLMDVAVEYGKQHGETIDEKVDATLDRLLVEFGKEILKIVPGKVSTEVDARFSFDTKGSVDKALHIIDVGPRFTVFYVSVADGGFLALQVHWHRQVPHSHQDRLNMGGYPSRPYPAT